MDNYNKIGTGLTSNALNQFQNPQIETLVNFKIPNFFIQKINKLFRVMVKNPIFKAGEVVEKKKL